MKRAALLLFGLASLTGGAEAAACAKSGATPVVDLRITQPVIAFAGNDDLSMQVLVREDGCVLIHYPAYDTRHGDYTYRLDARELRSLRAELRATGVSRFDPAAVRRDLASRALAKQAVAGSRLVHVSDEEVIELQIESAVGTKATEFAWSGLRAQRRNHPDQEAIAGLAAARERLLQLSTDRRAIKVAE